MTEEEYNEMYKRWLASKKHEEFASKMKQKKEEQPKELMTKDELIGVINSMMEYHALSSTDKEKSDWLLLSDGCDKIKMFNSLIHIVKEYTIYLRIYEELQEFEICAIIKALLDAETFEALRFCRLYLPLEEQEEQEFLDLQMYIRALVDDEFNNQFKNK
jgi:hypothetical protein